MIDGKSVLVVDDEPEVLGFLGEILEFQGASVELFESSSKALARCREKEFDLIISDVFMPELNGMELFTTLKDEKRVTKFIGMTGGGKQLAGIDMNLFQKLKELGMDDALKKPFDLQIFVNKVERCLAS